MEALFTSFFLVLLAEIGDRSQFLALFLSSRHRRPWAILGGYFLAVTINYGIAVTIGHYIPVEKLGIWGEWIIAFLFFAFAAWLIWPEAGEPEEPKESKLFGLHPFVASALLFFIVEMGDKTQISAMALATQFENVFLVYLGSVLGATLACSFAVLLGHRLCHIVSHRIFRWTAAALYFLVGLAILLRWF